MPLPAEPGLLALAFPGVGVRFCGHEASFFERHRAVMAPLLQQASEGLGQDLGACVARGESPELDERSGQIFATAMSCAVAEVFLASGLRPACVAGYSLGLYAALVAARAVSFADGLRITGAAHDVVREVCPDIPCGLAVVLGLAQAETEALLSGQTGPTVRLVNVNNHASQILSGPLVELQAMVQRARQAGALKALLLPVGLPYHHPELLRGARDRFEALLRTLTWHEPACPVISSLPAQGHAPLVDPGALLGLTARNICEPISWLGVVRAMADAGVDVVLECGAGISLTQNARLIPDSPRFINLKSSQARLGL